MRDIITEIWSTAKRNKLRTALTGFAVAWGIFMLIFLLGAGNGLINATEQNSGKFLANSMVVYGGRTSKAYKGLKEGRSVALNTRDMKTTNENFRANIDKMGASIQQNGVNISVGDNYISTTLSGVYPNEQQINKIEMLHGRYINNIDNSSSRKVLVLSEDQAKELMPGHIADLIGKYVNVGPFGFRIVGVYKADQSGQNANAYSAFNTVRTIYNRGDSTDEISFSFHGLKTNQDNEAFEKRYRAKLNTNHRAAPDDGESIWLWNRFTQSMQMATGTSVIRTALWVIGLFTLLSGIVGVSNIMLITVKERTREFGIRKALGAKPLSILWLIIVESVTITTIFGYIGMVAGIGVTEWMNSAFGNQTMDTGMWTETVFLNPTVDIRIAIQATLTLIIAGTLAGLFPARKAVSIRPIEALRAD